MLEYDLYFNWQPFQWFANPPKSTPRLPQGQILDPPQYNKQSLNQLDSKMTFSFTN